jgi:hypothetical protein
MLNRKTTPLRPLENEGDEGMREDVALTLGLAFRTPREARFRIVVISSLPRAQQHFKALNFIFTPIMPAYGRANLGTSVRDQDGLREKARCLRNAAKTSWYPGCVRSLLERDICEIPVITSHIQRWAHVWRHRIFGRIFGPTQLLFCLPRCITHLQLCHIYIT